MWCGRPCAVKDKLKIEFITDDNPLYILPFFEEFLRHYATEFEILRVSRCRPMGKRSRVKLLRGLICLYGFTGFLRLTVRLLALRASGLLLFSRRAGPAHSLSQLCRNYSIPCEKTQNPNRPEFVDRIRREAPDLLISVACPYILKEHLLSAPRLGCLNIHHASLPRYRGMMQLSGRCFIASRRWASPFTGWMRRLMKARLSSKARWILFPERLSII